MKHLKFSVRLHFTGFIILSMNLILFKLNLKVKVCLPDDTQEKFSNLNNITKNENKNISFNLSKVFFNMKCDSIAFFHIQV